MCARRDKPTSGGGERQTAKDSKREQKTAKESKREQKTAKDRKREQKTAKDGQRRKHSTNAKEPTLSKKERKLIA